MILPVKRLIQTRVPEGHCLHRVFARGCDAKSEMSVHVHIVLAPEKDAIGVPFDAVWRISATGVTDRFLRLKGGLRTLAQLLSKYLILDGTFCPFTFNVRESLEYLARDVSYTHIQNRHKRDLAWSCEILPLCAGPSTIEAPAEAQIMGIPQRTLKSGLCWYGSMWYAVLTPRVLRRVFRFYTRVADPVIAQLIDSILLSPSAAERVRRRLYQVYSIGDNPDQNPELDGQNGYKQLAFLFDALRIPYRTYLWDRSMVVVLLHDGVPPNGGRARPDTIIAGLRCPFNHRVPPFTFTEDGYTFELQSGLIGNQECGHQTALSRCADGSWWSAYDTDLVTLDVGPISFKVDDSDPMEMWATYERTTFVTKQTSSTKFCDMNAVNRTQDALVRLMDGTPPTKTLARVHVDWLYVGTRVVS